MKKLIANIALSVISFIPLLASAEAISFWKASNESSTTVVDHSGWQRILDRYIKVDTQNNLNLFGYSAISESTQDSRALAEYVKSLAAIDPRSLSKREQLPYWTNLYNALTVKLVVDAYPVESIKNVGPVPGLGPWDHPVVHIAGQPLTLNNIEHGILRPIWKDARIHYIINCASYGCPNLPQNAVVAEGLEGTLEAAAKDFINSPRGVNLKGNTLVLSSIYSWFAGDFGGSEKTVLQHIEKYATHDTLSKLQNYQGQIAYDYPWQLNQY